MRSPEPWLSLSSLDLITVRHEQPKRRPIPIWWRITGVVVVALVQFRISYSLINFAYALGDASQAIPSWLKVAMLIAGFPLVYPAYLVRFLQGQWSTAAFHMLIVLTPFNAAFWGWIIMKSFSTDLPWQRGV